MLLLLLAVIDDPDDRIFIEQLFLRYEHKMLAVAMNILKDQYLAEDAIHDTFLSIINNLRKLDKERNIEGYLIKSVRNRALDMIRKSRHEIVQIEIGDPLFSDLETNDDITHYDNIDLIEEAARIIALLPDKLRDVFILYYYHDMNCAEISRKLGISYDASFKRLSRAKEILKKKLKEEGFFSND